MYRTCSTKKTLLMDAVALVELAVVWAISWVIINAKKLGATQKMLMITGGIVLALTIVMVITVRFKAVLMIPIIFSCIIGILASLEVPLVQNLNIAKEIFFWTMVYLFPAIFIRTLSERMFGDYSIIKSMGILCVLTMIMYVRSNLVISSQSKEELVAIAILTISLAGGEKENLYDRIDRDMIFISTFLVLACIFRIST